LRFLWLEDPNDPYSKIIKYRFCSVVFGLNASPFLLNATLRHHISKYKSDDPEFVRKLLDSFYVDDLVSGEDPPAKRSCCLKNQKSEWLKQGLN
jgi:hypothetical protein